MKKFEYEERIIRPNRSTIAEHANELGKNGWELVDVWQDPEYAENMRAIFKRRSQGENEEQ